jgi:ribosomal protein S12 methylthiotransferase accessory factor
MTTEPTPEVADARAWLEDQIDAFCSPLPHAAAAAAALRQALDGAFVIRSPWAPGLKYVGALLRVPAAARHGELRVSVGGAALDLHAAARSCLGEAVERLGQIDDGALPLVRGSLGDTSSDAHRATLDAWARLYADSPAAIDPTRIDWLPAVVLGGGVAVHLPADLCLRRAGPDVAFVPRFALSTGCAAGATREHAIRGAILELVERDAASLWWVGGERGRALADSQGADVLAALRAGADARSTRLLDITSDLAIPCVAALSVDGDGRGLACGLAARETRGDAARAAILELAQMELALLLARAKARSQVPLAAGERAQLERATLFAIADEAIATPRGGPAARDLAAAKEGAPAALAAHLRDRGITLYAADLTRTIYEVPVVRVVAPALQLMPADAIGPRLAAAIARTGGGPGHVRKLPLI